MQSGKVLLLIIKKVYSSKQFFRGLKISDELKAFYDKTMEQLDKLLTENSFDADIVMALLTNLMIITENLAAWTKPKKTEKQRSKEVQLTILTVSHANCYKYINKVFNVERNKRRAECRSKIRDIILQRNKKHIVSSNLLKAVLSLIFAAFSIAFATSAINGINDIAIEQIRPEATDIWGSIANWWTYDLWQAPLPEVQREGVLHQAMPFTTIGAIVAGILALLVWVVPIVLKWIYKKRDQIIEVENEKAMRTWCEFRYLQKVLLATDVRIKEMEW